MEAVYSAVLPPSLMLSLSVQSCLPLSPTHSITHWLLFSGHGYQMRLMRMISECLSMILWSGWRAPEWLSLVNILKLNFEVKVWSRIWSWILSRILRRCNLAPGQFDTKRIKADNFAPRMQIGKIRKWTIWCQTIWHLDNLAPDNLAPDNLAPTLINGETENLAPSKQNKHPNHPNNLIYDPGVDKNGLSIVQCSIES